MTEDNNNDYKNYEVVTKDDEKYYKSDKVTVKVIIYDFR